MSRKKHSRRNQRKNLVKLVEDKAKKQDEETEAREQSNLIKSFGLSVARNLRNSFGSGVVANIKYVARNAPGSNSVESSAKFRIVTPKQEEEESEEVESPEEIFTETEPDSSEVEEDSDGENREEADDEEESGDLASYHDSDSEDERRISAHLERPPGGKFEVVFGSFIVPVDKMKKFYCEILMDECYSIYVKVKGAIVESAAVFMHNDNVHLICRRIEKGREELFKFRAIRPEISTHKRVQTTHRGVYFHIMIDG